VNAPDPAVDIARLRAEVAELRAEVRAHSPRFAAIYPAFEDRFRGAEAAVRERPAVYLPEVWSCVSDADGPRVRLPGVAATDTAVLAAALQKGLFGPQDYALLARAPG
jgi:hypothetical protein